jgi:ATP-binding cassette subfamily B protein/subfamily B ATP-binding cassette protein MsbA
MRYMAETPEERAHHRSKVLTRLVRMLRPYWVMVLGSFILVLVSAASQAAGPMLIGRAVDDVLAAKDRVRLIWIVLALLGTYLAGMLATRYQFYLMSLAGQRVLAEMRQQVMRHIHKLSLGFLERKEAGDLMSRLVNDIDVINNFFSQGLMQAVGALFGLVGVMVAMIALEWRLALATLAILPVMLMTTNLFGKVARRAFRKTRATIGDVSADLQEELGGIKVAQAFNRSDISVRRFAERNAANRDANVSANAVTSAFMPTMDVLSALDTAIVAGYGGYLAIQGAISVGVVVSFIQYVQNFFRPIQMVTQLWTTAQSALAAAERVFELLDIEPEIQDTPDAVELPKLKGQVRFENVSFSYDSDQPVLQDINLVANPGQMIAIVGPTGAGKSTLVSLLMRFYDVTSGKITLDGYDVRGVTQHSLRSQMGMVLQEPFLFSGSVQENIRYGRLDATPEEVEAAAKAANAHDFITRLLEGYATQVGERGSMLSQGQRQLISIARAILADPRILILDEATASVDTRTEVLIQKALGNLLKGRTSFVIAHRLFTVRNADLVAVVDESWIVERGTHAELLDKGGLYAELYRRQFWVPPEEVETRYGAPLRSAASRREGVAEAHVTA